MQTAAPDSWDRLRADRRKAIRSRKDSELSAIILRMIALNSLSAFTPDVTPASSTGGVAPVRRREAGGTSPEPGQSMQRPLDAAAAQAGSILPRGSLLDIRV